MNLLLNILGLFLMAAFMWLLWLPRRISAPLVEPERDGEGYYVKQRVTGGLLVAPKGE